MNKLYCPYCRRESEHEVCDHCHAQIPPQEEKQEQEEPVKVRKKNKEMKNDGT